MKEALEKVLKELRAHKNATHAAADRIKEMAWKGGNLTPSEQEVRLRVLSAEIHDTIQTINKVKEICEV